MYGDDVHDVCECVGTDGSVVEFSPATREARVRFPVSAVFFSPVFKYYQCANHNNIIKSSK